jgi:hypothetical protein
LFVWQFQIVVLPTMTKNISLIVLPGMVTLGFVVGWELVAWQKMPSLFAKNEWSTNEPNKFSEMDKFEIFR